MSTAAGMPAVPHGGARAIPGRVCLETLQPAPCSGLEGRITDGDPLSSGPQRDAPGCCRHPWVPSDVVDEAGRALALATRKAAENPESDELRDQHDICWHRWVAVRTYVGIYCRPAAQGRRVAHGRAVGKSTPSAKREDVVGQKAEEGKD